MEYTISVFVVAFLTGFYAQSWKGHTGAVWGLISLPVWYFFYEIFYRAVPQSPEVMRTVMTPGSFATVHLVIAVCAGLFSFAVMLFIVATLPNRRAAESREKVCPACAEKVKAAASICRFCGHQFSTPPSESRGERSEHYRPLREPTFDDAPKGGGGKRLPIGARVRHGSYGDGEVVGHDDRGRVAVRFADADKFVGAETLDAIVAPRLVRGR